ncbi:MAG: prevent-host-death protein [Cyanobacteria bacterium J06628_6]
MKQISIEAAAENLLTCFQQAKEDTVIVTQEGKPVGLIIGFGDDDDWWEQLLLKYPPFLEQIRSARQHLREGTGLSLAEVKAQYLS